MSFDGCFSTLCNLNKHGRLQQMNTRPSWVIVCLQTLEASSSSLPPLAPPSPSSSLLYPHLIFCHRAEHQKHLMCIYMVPKLSGTDGCKVSKSIDRLSSLWVSANMLKREHLSTKSPRKGVNSTPSMIYEWKYHFRTSSEEQSVVWFAPSWISWSFLDQARY